METEFDSEEIAATFAFADIIAPYIPVLDIALKTISETITIYEKAECNKEIVHSLIDRVLAAEPIIKTLKRKNEKNFRSQEYYNSFLRLNNVLMSIKNFVEVVSQFKGFKKFMYGNAIKEKFNSLTNEFETCIKDLNFTLAVTSEETRERDREMLEMDIEELRKHNQYFQEKNKESIQELQEQQSLFQEQEKERRIISLLIPTERLFVIRSNLKQFLNKWGTKKGNSVSELSKLKSPQEFSNYKYLSVPQWGSRATTVAGGILTLTGQPIIGGVMAAASPFVDVAATSLRENFYETKEKKWNEFLTDADMFLDNYHELLGIIKKVDSNYRLGKTKIVRNLKKETKEILEVYDKDDKGEEGYGEIDLQELIDGRTELAKDLTKDKKNSKWWAIVENIKRLENMVIAYQKDGFLIEEEIENQLASQTIPQPVPPKSLCQKIMSGQIIKGVKDWWTETKIKLNTPIQCWDCRECCQKEIKRDKGKEVVREEPEQQALQLQPTNPPKLNQN